MSRIRTKKQFFFSSSKINKYYFINFPQEAHFELKFPLMPAEQLVAMDITTQFLFYQLTFIEWKITRTQRRITIENKYTIHTITKYIPWETPLWGKTDEDEDYALLFMSNYKGNGTLYEVTYDSMARIDATGSPIYSFQL